MVIDDDDDLFIYLSIYLSVCLFDIIYNIYSILYIYILYIYYIYNIIYIYYIYISQNMTSIFCVSKQWPSGEAPSKSILLALSSFNLLVLRGGQWAMYTWICMGVLMESNIYGDATQHTW